MRAAAALIVGIAACSAGTDNVTFPKPSDATEIQRFPRGSGHQDYFVLRRQYPASDVIEHYTKVFDGWIPCYWNERDWDGYGDTSGTSPKYVHRVVRFWVRADNKALATVFARYESAYATCRDAPDNDKQEVVLLYEPTSDAKAMAEEIGAKCMATPNTTPHADARPNAASCSRPRARAGGRER